MKIPIQRLLVLFLFASILFACNKDKNEPVITIVGDNPLTHCVNFLYFDFGAVAYDDEDGDITDKIVTASSVTPSVVGTYTVTYSVKDKAGNRAEAIRTVEVQQCK